MQEHFCRNGNWAKRICAVLGVHHPMPEVRSSNPGAPPFFIFCSFKNWVEGFSAVVGINPQHYAGLGHLPLRVQAPALVWRTRSI
jgi:hypothetical protein